MEELGSRGLNSFIVSVGRVWAEVVQWPFLRTFLWPLTYGWKGLSEDGWMGGWKDRCVDG